MFALQRGPVDILEIRRHKFHRTGIVREALGPKFRHETTILREEVNDFLPGGQFAVNFVPAIIKMRIGAGVNQRYGVFTR